MKLVINYDFFESVKKINDFGSNFALIKERSKKFVKIDLPIFATIGLALGFSIPKTIALIGVEYFLSIAFLNVNKLGTLRMQKEYDNHRYNLIALPYKLQDLDLITDYDLLLKSKVNKRRINFVLNNYHMPSLNIMKTIDMPVQDNNGEIKEVSVEQEHIIGSKDYVLTLKH